MLGTPQHSHQRTLAWKKKKKSEDICLKALHSFDKHSF